MKHVFFSIRDSLLACTLGCAICCSCGSEPGESGSRDENDLGTGRMACRLKKPSVAFEDDIHQLNRFAISPSFETFFEPGEATRADWKQGIGVVLEAEKGRAGSLLFASPFMLHSERESKLEIELSSKGEAAVDLLWRDERCKVFGDECRKTLHAPAGRGQLEAVFEEGELTGSIAELRLDFTGVERLTVHRINLPRSAPHSKKPSARKWLGRGKNGIQRIRDGGRLGWRIPTGGVLECRYPEDAPPDRRPPSELSIRVDSNRAPVQFFELEATWSGGREETAARFVGSFVNQENEEWTTIPLEAPAGEVDGLNVSLICYKNCDAIDEAGLSLAVEQPRYRYRVSSPGAESPKNLVLIVLDTLRADRLPIYGGDAASAPFLRKWSKSATIYERYVSGDTWTLPAHATMFTGRYPLMHLDGEKKLFPFLPLSEQTIAEQLADRGYATRALADSCVMDYTSRLDQGFDRFINAYEPIAHKADRALAQLDELEEQGAPFFLFFHSYEIHSPYSYNARSASWVPRGSVPAPSHMPRNRKNFAIGRESTVDWLETGHTEKKVEHLLAAYDSAIAESDRALRRLIERIESSELADDTVIIVTSDHGEEFMEHQRVGHAPRLPYLETVHVPLLVKMPGQTGAERISTLTSQTSFPRIALEAIGQPVPKRMRNNDGQAWAASFENLGRSRDKYRAGIFFEDLHLLAVCDLLRMRIASEELYRVDFRAAPGRGRYEPLDGAEKKRRAKTIDRMRGFLLAKLKESYGTRRSKGSGAGAEAEPVPPEDGGVGDSDGVSERGSPDEENEDSLTLRQMRALGYIE